MARMDRLHAMYIFSRVVEQRSFSRVAADLGIPRSTITDAVKQLEARLGVKLLLRTTRSVVPTLDGDVYYQRCLHILAEVEHAESAFAGAKPRGRLRVDVHGTLARHFVLPRLPEFLQNYPDLDVHISEGDRLVDPVREGIDCVLRVGKPKDSDLIARQITTLNEATLAAPTYLDRCGIPQTLEMLEGHRMIGFRSTVTDAILPLEFTCQDTVKAVMLPMQLSVCAAESYLTAARAGLGLIQIPRYHALADLAQGTLVEILPHFPPPPLPVSLLYPRHQQRSPRVRVFLDWVCTLFSPSTEGIPQEKN